MNPIMVDDGLKVTGKSLKSNGKEAVKGMLFFLPFIATYFSENARAALAKALMDDVSGVLLIAENPVD